MYSLPPGMMAGMPMYPAGMNNTAMGVPPPGTAGGGGMTYMPGGLMMGPGMGMPGMMGPGSAPIHQVGAGGGSLAAGQMPPGAAGMLPPHLNPRYQLLMAPGGAMGPIAQGSVPIKPLGAPPDAFQRKLSQEQVTAGQQQPQGAARTAQGQTAGQPAAQSQAQGQANQQAQLQAQAQSQALAQHLQQGHQHPGLQHPYTQQLAALMAAHNQAAALQQSQAAAAGSGHPTQRLLQAPPGSYAMPVGAMVAGPPGSAPIVGAAVNPMLQQQFNLSQWQTAAMMGQQGMGQVPVPGMPPAAPFMGYNPAMVGQMNSQLPMRHLLPMRDIGDLSVVYFNMGKFVGRGGSLRFFLLGKQIKHKFENVLIKDWIPTRKQELLDSGDYPLGQLPTIRHNGRPMFETIPILRYLAKKIGEYGAHHFNDYLADLMCERVAYWRDEIMAAIGEHSEESATFDHYLAIRESQYELFETLLQRSTTPAGGPGSARDSTTATASTERSNTTEGQAEGGLKEAAGGWTGMSAGRGTGANGAKLTFCDFALYSCVYDDLKLTEPRWSGEGGPADSPSDNEPLGPNLLGAHPRLKALFEEIHVLPLIANWRDEMDALLNPNTGDGEIGDEMGLGGAGDGEGWGFETDSALVTPRVPPKNDHYLQQQQQLHAQAQAQVQAQAQAQAAQAQAQAHQSIAQQQHNPADIINAQLAAQAHAQAHQRAAQAAEIANQGLPSTSLPPSIMGLGYPNMGLVPPMLAPHAAGQAGGASQTARMHGEAFAMTGRGGTGTARGANAYDSSHPVPQPHPQPHPHPQTGRGSSDGAQAATKAATDDG